MPRSIRIGNAHGFWGDRIEAAVEMLAREPQLDYITLDFLAEVSMSILAGQRARDPAAGWPRDFLEVIRTLAPYWRDGGRCQLITNAGGLNPLACATACRQVLTAGGCDDLTIAVVSGDDVLAQIRADDPQSEWLKNLDTGQAIAAVRERLVTANAYVGAQPIVEALAHGADIVITGRVADPSLTVGPCAFEFGWRADEWHRLAGATVAGHLIECGTQVTGGISTDWLDMPDVAQIGFPIAEVWDDGSCVITKPRGSGGRVTAETVKEQLVYEIGDPGNYLSPDVAVSFLTLQVEDQGSDRVRVSGASGRSPPQTWKVSATYQDGVRAQAQLTVIGRDAAAKAHRAGQAVLDGLARDGVTFRESLVESLGAGTTSVLRIAAADESRAAVERFARTVMPLVTAGPPGTTGYADGRPRVHPMFRFWPCLIDRARVTSRVEVLAAQRRRRALRDENLSETNAAFWSPEISQPNSTTPTPLVPRPGDAGSRLGDIALARSGDKGIHANVGVIARRPDDFERLRRFVTADRVAAFFQLDPGAVRRFELPNLAALNFLLAGILANPLRVDAQGKALGQVLLEMPWHNE